MNDNHQIYINCVLCRQLIIFFNCVMNVFEVYLLFFPGFGWGCPVSCPNSRFNANNFSTSGCHTDFSAVAFNFLTFSPWSEIACSISAHLVVSPRDSFCPTAAFASVLDTFCLAFKCSNSFFNFKRIFTSSLIISFSAFAAFKDRTLSPYKDKKLNCRNWIAFVKCVYTNIKNCYFEHKSNTGWKKVLTYFRVIIRILNAERLSFRF